MARAPFRDRHDADVLREAAEIMKRRSTRPGFWLDVYCGVLTKAGDAIHPKYEGCSDAEVRIGG